MFNTQTGFVRSLLELGEQKKRVVPIVVLFFMAVSSFASDGNGHSVWVKHGTIPPPVIEEEEAVFRNRGVDVQLGGGLMRVLAKIRTDWPETAGVNARLANLPGVLLLELGPAMAEVVHRVLPPEGASGDFHTGYRDFDRLNQTVGLRIVQTFSSIESTIFIAFDRGIDLAWATMAYAALEEVSSAAPNANLLQGSDIYAHWAQDQWHVVFRKAWGDCPSGCLFTEDHFFLGQHGSVVRIDPTLAYEIPGFHRMIGKREWTSGG